MVLTEMVVRDAKAREEGFRSLLQEGGAPEPS